MHRSVSYSFRISKDAAPGLSLALSVKKQTREYVLSTSGSGGKVGTVLMGFLVVVIGSGVRIGGCVVVSLSTTRRVVLLVVYRGPTTTGPLGAVDLVVVVVVVVVVVIFARNDDVNKQNYKTRRRDKGRKTTRRVSVNSAQHNETAKRVQRRRSC